MPDASLLKERLEQIKVALIRVSQRTAAVSHADDFVADEAGLEKLDAVAMLLIAIGESFKSVDQMTSGTLLAKYPQIDWKGVKGVRDILAHHYFDLDHEEIFDICKNGVPQLIAVVDAMLAELF
jgi:uncharacterized protein with HEPN domain